MRRQQPGAASEVDKDGAAAPRRRNETGASLGDPVQHDEWAGWVPPTVGKIFVLLRVVAGPPRRRGDGHTRILAAPEPLGGAAAICTLPREVGHRLPNEVTGIECSPYDPQMTPTDRGAAAPLRTADPTWSIIGVVATVPIGRA
jgi:hypothetical protein